MISIERLNSYNLEMFKSINNENLQKDEFDKNFLSYYEKEKFINKVLLKKYIKIFMLHNQMIGYIWCDISINNKVKIWAIYVKESYIDILNSNTLGITNNKKLVYEASNKFKNDIMEKLGFSIKGRAKIMKLILDDFKYKNETNILKENVEKNNKVISNLNNLYSISNNTITVSIDEFNIETDKALRCRIQNDIFKEKERVPLSIYDIENDILQDYYIPELCLFIRINNITLGYGQVIYSSGNYTVVNFGILKDFRGCNLGRLLLVELINRCSKKGIDTINIKVEERNLIAVNLYSSLGFKEKYIINQWER